MHDWHAIQRRLAALGFDPGPIDGIRGPRTDAALVAFKRSIGFRARPLYGPLTHAALMGAPEPSEAADALPWMREAARMRGLHERRDEATLEGWMRRHLPGGAWWTSSRWVDVPNVPWCGLFIATCLRAAGMPEGFPANPLSARAWAGWGKAAKPTFGALLVFTRSGGGHVGFYHGEDRTHFHVLGGNQSNAVTVTRIAKSRHEATRWPANVPQTTRGVLVDAESVPVSRNEA